MGITIALGRLVTETVVTSTAGLDLGKRPKVRGIQTPRAMIWLNDGAASDLQKAETWAASDGEGWRVFSFPATEPDPLGRVKMLLTKDLA